jgi:hypothetical protein
MTWLTWRLQRAELILLGLMLSGLTGLLVLTHSDVVALSKLQSGESCPGVFVDQMGNCIVKTSWLYQLVDGVLPFLNFLPLIAAILIALPIVSELENGSYRLAWTQGITRDRWTRVKFGVLLAGGIAFSAIFALTFEWWSSPDDALRGRLDKNDFDFRGVVPVGHTIFAIGLMLAIGCVIRRPVPTIVISAIAYVGIRLPFIIWIRERLISPLTKEVPLFNDPVGTAGPVFGEGLGSDDWQLSWFWQTSAGERINESQFQELCPPIMTADRGSSLPVRDPLQTCIEQHGLTQYVTYHPDSRYWSFQLIETGIFLGVGLVLIGFAAWWVMRRVE